MNTLQLYTFTGIASFILSVILGFALIPVLRRIKAGQTEREEGPESHKKKTGTPVMGGFIFLIASTVVLLFFVTKEPGILPVLLLTWGFALVGFIDDFIKVVLKRSEGLKVWQKFVLQIAVALLFVLYHYYVAEYRFAPIIPFSGGAVLSLGVVAIPLSVFIIVGTVNGSNFTDGVDGLEASVTTAMMVFFLLVSLAKGYGFASVISIVFIGSLCGFLVFNVNKAKVFMGDTGSLGLGGLVAGMAYMLHLELFLPLIAIIYFAEVLSVILQVSYFKATHGKRIFRMTPIHHHFELGGWTETKVVYIFTLVTAIVCAVIYAFM